MASIASLSRAASGLMANQRALQTTAHNLSNVDTPGYVRQQVLFTDSSYVTVGRNGHDLQKVGLGTDILEIRQVRDVFLDKAYREESGRKGYYDAKYQAIAELETIFGELEGEGFGEIIEELWESINELSKHPEGLETRGAFVQSASVFIDRVNLVYDQIGEYQANLNTQVIDMVNEINELGDTIAKLNDEINKYEAFGDNANDLRDQRNNALDRLGQLVDITYKEEPTGKVMVNIENMNFISPDGVTSYLELEQAEEFSPFVKPVWESYDKDLFTDYKPISLENNNDKGALKGLLIARGTRQANYTDLQDQDYYNGTIKESVIMKTQAQFDQLVNEIVTIINNALSPIEGDPPVFDEDNAPYGLDGSQGTELFIREHYSRFDEDGNFIEEDSNDYYTLYTSGNLKINPEILKNYDLIALSGEAGDIADSSVIESILADWKASSLTLEPEGTSEVNINEYYGNFISELGYEGNVAYELYRNQETMVSLIDNQRSQLMGVSSDEELGNMMKYQHAYNASARLVSTIDEMIEHIIMRVGIVGR
ncbi:flagellar hook-associated protein 1 FlgK [Natranaerovirga hydrolytica]|uniref:Flagellar hook-associated protein 1 n=1 Tax=Natranaerovirga hydrolytica TaxID=680378 RepID=A0A4R1MKL9_9FIRM|nr:flagellar hook-associated protein FlgK [Natranaerovirga hydrolytica]TCK93378.1 flagellar hook-associated protein 1 FlgK [Natranaerovirga hydrolytica]